MAIERNARATWTGDLTGGQGEFDLESSHAVERHPDAARIDEVGLGGAAAAKLEVAMAEDDLPLLHPCEEA